MLRFCQLAGDGQPQTAATLRAAAGAIHPVETFKDVRKSLLWDTRPAIVNGQNRCLRQRNTSSVIVPPDEV